MTHLFDNIPAFSLFQEPLTWKQDAHPHTSGEIRGTVLHGHDESESAGHTSSRIYADAWTVIIPSLPAFCIKISPADKLIRLSGKTLTVQQVTRDCELGWVVTCTCKERAVL